MTSPHSPTLRSKGYPRRSVFSIQTTRLIGGKGLALDEAVIPQFGTDPSIPPDAQSIHCLQFLRPLIGQHRRLCLHPQPQPQPPRPMPLRPRLPRRTSSTPSSDAKSKESRSSTVFDAARAATPVALTALVQSTDVFPPLKSAVSFLLQVHDICEKMKSNREGADELRIRIEGVRICVVEAFQDEKAICVELYDALVQFDDALTNILVAVDDVRWRKSRLSRLAFSARDAETLRIVKQRLDDAMRLLMLIVTLHQSTTLRSISQTLDATVVSVSRVKGLVLEVGCMRTQLSRVYVQPRQNLPGLFFLHPRGRNPDRPWTHVEPTTSK